jgi:diguanylate cyclase (GGDEF)-like protein
MAYTLSLMEQQSQKPVVRLLAWLLSLALIALLGLLRISTDAQFLFASAAVLPVMALAWIGGRPAGNVLSALAASMWFVADLTSSNAPPVHVLLVNAVTQLAVYNLVVYLVTEIRTMLARERDISSHDALTGLLNRRAFLDFGEAEAQRLLRYGHSVALAFLDLDDFKRLNDQAGHQAGDEALKATAAALTATTRSTDHVVRIGGDEFVVLLPEITYQDAISTIGKVIDSTQAALRPFPPVSVSAGLAWFEVPTSLSAMLAAADALMYESKQQGKHGLKSASFAAQTEARPAGTPS